MSDIRQVDAAFHVKRVLSERSPAQDFSRELAKTGAGKMVNHAYPRDNLADRPAAPALATASKSSFDPPHAPTEAPAVVAPIDASGVALQERLSVAVQPTGITEALLGSRVYGVHLLASTYLSELTMREEPDTEVLSGATLPLLASTPSQGQAVVSEVPPDSSEAASNASLPEETVAVLSALVEGDATEATSHTPSLDGASVALAETSTMFWPESSLRLTRQRDGSAVIWLRDYRMPDEGASQVVDVLVKEAGTAGIRLGRIVLNGREVWTSPKNY